MKKYFSKMDKPLILITIAFFIFGLVMILSASSMESLMRYERSPYYYFGKQAIFLIAGLILFLITIRIPTKLYQSLYRVMYLIMIITLSALIMIGYSAKGTQGWFNLGPISIQPSEFAKIIEIIFLACYYERNKLMLDNHKTLIKPLIFVLLMIILVFVQPDFGTSIVLTSIAFFMFMSIPMKKKYKRIYTSLIILAALLFTIAFIPAKDKLFKPYQLERFNFKNPCDRYQEDSGYQLCNSFIAFTNGGLTGQGIGNSTQKYLYLPESYTDFIFPIIVEEWGMITGIILVILYFVIIYRIYKIAKKSTSLENSLIAYGVCIYILLHISINLIGVMGLGPLTGIPLPFLSYGGSYTCSLMISLGLVQRVCIENNKNKTKKKKRNKE